MVLLIYGPKQLDGAGRQVVLLIFVSGKIVLTGAKEKQARTHPPRRRGAAAASVYQRLPLSA